VSSRLRTGNTRATHASVMHKDLSTECHFCAVKITVDHILWDCKETEIKRLQINITKEIWKGGKEEIEKLLQRNISNKVSKSGQMDKNDPRNEKFIK
jgi:hypothetical protein